MSRSLASIAARGLTVAVASRVLLSDVGLSVGPGTRLGLTGPNGSGKSTLLRVLAGLHPPDRGTVRLMPGDATVGYLPQETELDPGETVTQMLARRTGVAAAQQALDAATAALAESSGTGAADGQTRPAGGETAKATDANERYATALDRWLGLGAADLEVRAAAVADDLGLPPSTLHRDLTHLSGGQRARVQLAALLLARFDVFLLDEPTNDLDLAGLNRLERFVTGLAGPVVLVSHDRAFLERTVTAVAEIDPQAQTLARYDGGWQAFVDERRRARQLAEEEYRTYVGERDRLRDQARRQREWSARGVRTARRSEESDKFIRFGHTQGAQNSGARAAQTERALTRITPVEKPWEAWDLRMEIADAGRSGDVVVRLQEAVVERPGGTSTTSTTSGFRLGPVTLEIGRGDRVALLGANGSGKTTLLEAMLGRLPLTTGTRWQGPGVVVGEIEQARHSFAAAPTLLEGFRRRTGITSPAEARSLLAKFSLGADQVLRTPPSLSPGERTRAALAVLQATGVNLLALDEPTNHLDLPAIEQLEQALGQFGGTLILVTHDRRLLDEVHRTRVFDVEDGQVRERR